MAQDGSGCGHRRQVVTEAHGLCAGEEPQEVRTLVEVQSETSKDMKDAQTHLDQNVLGQLRRGSLGLDSGLSGGLFSAAAGLGQRLLPVPSIYSSAPTRT